MKLVQLGTTPNYHYSTHQIMYIHDELMFGAIQPLVYYTHLVDEMLPLILGKVGVLSRRKLSNNQEDLPSLAVRFMLETEAEKKMHLLKDMELERNIVHRIVSKVIIPRVKRVRESFLSATIYNTKEDTDVVDQATKDWRVHDKDRFFSKLNEIEYLFTQMSDYRNSVMEQYIKKAYGSAKAIAKSRPWISVDDLHKTYLVYVFKAIDKIDVKEGTLTNYINLWWKHVLNKSECFEYEISYVLPSSVRKRDVNIGLNNLSKSLDDVVEVGEEDTQNLKNSYTEAVLAYIDPTGVYRLSKGI